MAFQPDILITTPAGRIMVIEAKVTMNDLPRTEEALKRHMVGMQYPFGLLITPEKGWVYRDLYSGLSADSIKQVGEFDSTQIWRRKPPRQGLEFEAFVQQWIEDLADYPPKPCRLNSKTSFRISSYRQSPAAKLGQRTLAASNIDEARSMTPP